MSTISIKMTYPIELEKLCLLKSKIAETELLFKMTEKNYRQFITLLFVSDNFLKEITDFLAYNYPIATQECMLSVNCEQIFRKFQKTLLQLQHHNQMIVFCQLNVISLLLRIIPVSLKSLLQLQIRNQMLSMRPTN